MYLMMMMKKNRWIDDDDDADADNDDDDDDDDDDDGDGDGNGDATAVDTSDQPTNQFHQPIHQAATHRTVYTVIHTLRI